MEYITDQDKFLDYLLHPPHISPSVFILRLSHTNLQTVFFSFVVCLKTHSIVQKTTFWEQKQLIGDYYMAVILLQKSQISYGKVWTKN